MEGGGRTKKKWKLRHEQFYRSELKHYGILGMKWGVRKDEVGDDVWRYLNSERQLNDLSANEFLGARFDDGSQTPNYIGNYTDPHAYQDRQTQMQEDSGVQRLGIENFFNVDGWNSATDRERAAAHDYVTGLGCKLMNGVLRGTISDQDIAQQYSQNTVKAVHDSVDMFSSMMDQTTFSSRAVLSRKTSADGLAGLLGISQSDLRDVDVLQSLIGSRCVEPGFMSTTMIGNASNMGSSYGDIKMFINAKEGSSGMYLEPAAEKPLSIEAAMR